MLIARFGSFLNGAAHGTLPCHRRRRILCKVCFDTTTVSVQFLLKTLHVHESHLVDLPRAEDKSMLKLVVLKEDVLRQFEKASWEDFVAGSHARNFETSLPTLHASIPCRVPLALYLTLRLARQQGAQKAGDQG